MEKEGRRKEAQFKKEEAVLRQRIELLELQLKEMEEREGDQKRMYDRLFKALDEQGAQGSNGHVSTTHT